MVPFCHNQIFVAAHRGNWLHAPENSLQAIEDCLTIGVDILELDLQRTADGKIVVMHDKTLDRTTTGTGFVSDYRWNEIRNLQLKDIHGLPTDERIVTLVEVMNLIQGKCMVYLDKSVEFLPETIDVLEVTNTIEQAIFYGNKPLPQVRQDFGKFISSINYIPQINDATPNLNDFIHTFLNEFQPWAFMVKFETEESAVLSAIAEIRRVGVHVWATPTKQTMCAGRTDTLALQNPDDNWGWMIENGIDIICTDHPISLMDYLHQKGLHN